MSRAFSVFCAALLALPLQATAQQSHLCTGLGIDDRIEAAAFAHTLRLIFADKSRHYLGEIAIRVTEGDKVIFDDTCDGPWLLLNVPSGTYRIESTFEGETKTGTVRLRGKGPDQHLIVY